MKTLSHLGADDIIILETDSLMTHTYTSLVPWTGLQFWGVYQQCTTGNDRFRVARGLQPSLLFVWRVLFRRQVLAQLAAVPLPLWPDV